MSVSFIYYNDFKWSLTKIEGFYLAEQVWIAAFFYLGGGVQRVDLLSLHPHLWSEVSLFGTWQCSFSDKRGAKNVS